ncbi:MAG: N(4)-(beta-N-acetylglucosaminyl)-L-asparaginase [Bacteroidetes bacterium]|nr:N(4)-(beta-N-acetylglucosaminyl)-L-asparaginase [Bacteroidota bacterium]
MTPQTTRFAMPRTEGIRPVSIASYNGLESVRRATEGMRNGEDTLDAVLAGVNIVEDDPADDSVGYGGLPNEDGVVELDSCVMHGPTMRGAGVAALRGIRNPSRVAKVVMERTDHVLLVGEGALRFARAHGFREENLLTDASREKWLRWKERLSTEDDWLPPHTPEDRNIGALALEEYERPTGTINCLGVNANGDVSGVTTTSGLAFKIPGRVGDSPILGAGLYVDNSVGAAGSTGRGEANLLSLASFLIVERMRQGDTPTDACLFACRRIVEQTKMKRLLDKTGRPAFNVNFYALTIHGEHGSASIWSGKKYAVNDGGESRLLDAAFLYQS